MNDKQVNSMSGDRAVQFLDSPNRCAVVHNLDCKTPGTASLSLNNIQPYCC